MATTNQPAGVNSAGSYGYASDEVKVVPFSFGLNQKVRLVKFEWIPNGGKDGAEQEALDIIFNINGTEKSYRRFPVVKAFGENNEEITDPTHPKFKEAMQDFNAVNTHILHCFRESDDIKAAFSVPITSFKQYCQLAMSILPTSYKEVDLDIFLQWAWNLGEKDRTYLEIPTKMKSGRWLSKHIPGNWKEKKVENPSDTVREALYYENEQGEKHVFSRNGWFMNSNYGKPQFRPGSQAEQQAASGASSEVAAENKPLPSTGKAPSAW